MNLIFAAILLLFADRPVTCTPGVAWFDETAKVLYTCGPANTWKASYAPKGNTLPPIPPLPPENKAPVITVKTPKDWQVITATNSFAIAADLTDDVDCKCVAVAELWISHARVRQTFGTKSISYTWNAHPYKGKGPVLIEFMAQDAEGFTTWERRSVTVPKK